MNSNLPNSFNDILISESEQIVSQQSDPNVHTTKKSQRSKNFSPEEDCLLVFVMDCMLMNYVRTFYFHNILEF